MIPDNVRQLRRRTAQDAMFRYRWKTNWPAGLQTPSGLMLCIIEDISAVGAKLHVGLDTPDEGCDVSLVLAESGTVTARVAWRRSDRVGLYFAAMQPWVLSLVAAAETRAQETLSGQSPR